MSLKSEFLAEIERFLRKSGMGHTTFGLKAVNDAKLVDNLRSGGDVRTKTVDRVRAFIRDQEGNGPAKNEPLRVGARF